MTHGGELPFPGRSTGKGASHKPRGIFGNASAPQRSDPGGETVAHTTDTPPGSVSSAVGRSITVTFQLLPRTQRHDDRGSNVAQGAQSDSGRRTPAVPLRNDFETTSPVIPDPAYFSGSRRGSSRAGRGGRRVRPASGGGRGRGRRSRPGHGSPGSGPRCWPPLRRAACSPSPGRRAR